MPGRDYSVPIGSRNLQVRAEASSATQYHLLELIWNGKVIRAVEPEPVFPFRSQLDHELDVTESGWLALRCTADPEKGPFALDTMLHTSPVAVRLEESPHWAQPKITSSLLAELDEVIAWTRTRTPPRPRLVRLYEEARTRLARNLS